MHGTYQRTPKPLLREDITSQVNLSALGPALQPVIEETLEETGNRERQVSKGNDFDAAADRLCRSCARESA